jgi:hypothetical protein
MRESDTETAQQFPVRKIQDILYLSDLVPGPEQVEVDHLVHSFLTEFEVIPVNS